MKALSIKQPWATLIAHGIKDIENRTWKTKFRGRIYIHASAKEVPDKDFSFSKEQHYVIHENAYDADILNAGLDKSAIIGEVDIIDCVINHPSIWAEQTKVIGQTIEGDPLYSGKPIYNWVLDNAVLYEKPILNIKGSLSFWEPNPNTVCMNCGNDFFGHEPQYCCNGRDCGCMGQPTEPVVCSEKCYKLIMKS